MTYLKLMMISRFQKSRRIDIDNIEIFKILVNPDLNIEDIKDFNNNKESGFIKIRTINPPMDLI